MKNPERYEQMMATRCEMNTYFDALQNIYIAIMRSIDNANYKLNGSLNDFRHFLNDQMIDLKYGKDYRSNFLDEILTQVDKL